MGILSEKHILWEKLILFLITVTIEIEKMEIYVDILITNGNL